ncbi:unnamed protein product [Paramecium octaurelia]|uniref:RING-type domain-containing protein n=1 Tax=Paramecium octaurelia TaxID=43137 RepID=A0A8S1WI68_PAROT|nr:unnamed protein product [Paramecium octaurelia]
MLKVRNLKLTFRMQTYGLLFFVNKSINCYNLLIILLEYCIMKISSLIEEIIETGSQGKELIKDAFIIGIAWGRQQLRTLEDLQSAIKFILKVNEKIDNSLESPFSKEDKYENFVVDYNFALFTKPGAIKLCQTTPPQKKTQENQQPIKNQKSNSPFYFQGSPQKTQYAQTSKMCQLCNFVIDTKTNDQKAVLLRCSHQFHFLCLSISTFAQGNHCPICQEQLEKKYPEYIFDQLPQQLKSSCPQIGCSNSFLYYGQDVFDCSFCKTQWCLKCKKKYHKNQACTFEIDHFEMRLGQKFKYCLNCNKVLFLTELPQDSNNQGIMPLHCEK